jgi:N-acetyltransferase
MVRMACRHPNGRSLVGSWVRLDRTMPTDVPELFAALDDDRVYAFGYGGGPAGRPADAAAMAAILADAIADGSRAMYTVRLTAESTLGSAGQVVGTSTLGDVDVPNERMHLGWTAYAPTVWGSVVNPECKRLLLGHAFDDSGFGRVKIQTDARNLRSQAAIAKLGAVREGVLRRHVRRADGTFRDTVVFSILVTEWPAVRARLDARIVAAAP